MIDTKIRVGEKRYFDNKAFPRGFGKSGNFTLVEDDVLSSYGQTLIQLESGELLPINAEEKHFLKVLKNPGKARSRIEQIWLKYLLLSRGRRTFYPLTGMSKRYDRPKVVESEMEEELEMY